MPTTSRFALPYPNNTDPVSAYPAQAKTLAQTVDTHLKRAAAGRAAATVSTANTVATFAVTLPVGRFTALPRFSLTPISSNPQNVSVGLTDLSSSSFTLNVHASAAATINVDWLAIQA